MDVQNTPEPLKASSSSSTTNINSNVRTRVNEWVSSFLTEMSSKGPAVYSVNNTSNKEITIELPAPIVLKPCLPCLNEDIAVKKDDAIAVTQLDCSHKPIPIEVTTSGCDANSGVDDLSVNAAKFWQTPSILSTFSKSTLEKLYPRSAFNTTASKSDAIGVKIVESQIDESTTRNNSLRSIGRVKVNSLYNKLSITRSKFNAIRDRRMEVKQLIGEAKERLSVSRGKLANEIENTDGESATTDEEQQQQQQQQQMASMNICDNLDMDISLDELSHISQSTENISVDGSLTMSMPSIEDGTVPLQHLNVGRKTAIGDIGRSTSDNPRLRYKFHLGDIGRSFSENQVEEDIAIVERNISAPSSSIAIENNNRGHSNYLERRAYSVSPTQSNVRRGILFRDQSLNERSTSRASGGASLNRESSLQSDSSRCSSVESLLDARRPDSEAILRRLGFGPVQQEDLLSRIPKRFLKPSQVRGIDTEAFMRQQLIASNIHEQAILGYRGLVGNPHVTPSLIVAKLMERFQLNDGRSNKVMDVINGNRPLSAPPTPGPNSHDSMS